MRADLRRLMAIARRDGVIFTSYRLNMLLRFVGIWYFAISFYFVGQFVGKPSSIADLHGGYFEFVLIGAIVTTFATLGVSAFSMNITAEQSDGTLEAVLTTPTPMWVVLGGGFLVPAMFAISESTVLLGVGLGVFGDGIPVAPLLLAVPLLVLTTASFATIGIIAAAVIVVVKRGDPFGGPIRQLTMLLSGALYPIEVLPGWLQAFSKLMPAYYGVRGMRQIVQAREGFAAGLDELAILAVFTVVLLPVSVLIFRRAVGNARRNGTLATY